MLNGVNDTLNAASAAGPLVLIALATLFLAAVIGVGIWKLIPLLIRLADKIPAALEIMKADVAKANQASQANSSAVGGLAEVISQLIGTINARDEKRDEHQLKLSESQENLSSHFGRSVDVLSNVYDRMTTQSTQIDVLIGTASATKRTADETHSSVGQIKIAINEGVGKLDKIVELLGGLKQHAEDKTQQVTMENLLNTAIDEIRGLKTTIDSIYAMPFDKKELPQTEGEVQP